MPAGLLTTRPLAVPPAVTWLTTLTVNANPETTTLKVAVQDMLPLIVTVPSLQSALPDQPANVDPVAAVAVNVTDVPLT